MKNMVKPNRKVLTAFGRLLTVVALILVACGGTTTSSSTTAKTTPTNTPAATVMPSPITHLKPGQTAEFVGKWKIGVYDFFAIAPSIFVTVSMTNTASVEQQENSFTDWSLTDVKGNTYKQIPIEAAQTGGSTLVGYIPPEATVGPDSAIPAGAVEPRVTVGGYIVFTVPNPKGQYTLTFSQGGLTASWDISVGT